MNFPMEVTIFSNIYFLIVLLAWTKQYLSDNQNLDFLWRDKRKIKPEVRGEMPFINGETFTNSLYV